MASGVTPDDRESNNVLHEHAKAAMTANIAEPNESIVSCTEVAVAYIDAFEGSGQEQTDAPVFLEAVRDSVI